MKPLKISLRIWIAITSLVTFLGGWLVFSHSGKPASLFSSSTSSTQPNVSTTIDPIPTLPPVPSLNSLVTPNGSSATTNNNTNTLQSLPSISSNNTVTRPSPRFRSGGS